MSKDYYSILGVDKNASQDEIKKAFRKKAHQHHPDKKDGNEAKFKEINEAYQILGNQEKKSQYDQFGTTFDSAGMGNGAGGQGFNWQDFAQASGGAQGFNFNGFRSSVNFDGINLEDLMGDLFGMGGRSRGQSRASNGEDIQIQMTIDFREAVFGAEKIINLEKLDICDKCKGNGVEPGSKIITCPECKGAGQIEHMNRTILGMFKTASLCPTCKGEGKKPEKYCNKCHGEGRHKTTKEIKIKIPAGIDTGESIRISGQGNAGVKNTISGDLYITFDIQSDPEFERQEYNILSQAEINISQAALGDKINVNTLDGPVKLKIPNGTQSGKVFVLKGKGVPVLNAPGRRGDQIVEVTVVVPTKLSRQQKRLLEELNETM